MSFLRFFFRKRFNSKKRPKLGQISPYVGFHIEISPKEGGDVFCPLKISKVHDITSEHVPMHKICFIRKKIDTYLTKLSN